TAAAEAAAVARTAATAAPVAAATAAATRPAAAAGRHEIDEQDDDAHKKSEGERRADIAPQEPGQRRDEAAGGERTEAPAERRTQSTADDEHDEDQERIERIEMTEHSLAIPMRRLRFGQLLSINQANHLVDAVGNAAGEIAALEFRRDHLVDDPLGGNVGKHALEAVADLDAQAAVVLGDHQQRTVIDLLAADLPRFGDTKRKRLDRLAVGGRHDQHRDLAALAPLQIGQRLRQLRDIAARQRAGLIDHAPCELGHSH